MDPCVLETQPLRLNLQQNSVLHEWMVSVDNLDIDKSKFLIS